MEVFTPKKLGEMIPNLTFAYFSNGLVKNHHLVSYSSGTAMALYHLNWLIGWIVDRYIHP